MADIRETMAKNWFIDALRELRKSKIWKVHLAHPNHDHCHRTRGNFHGRQAVKHSHKICATSYRRPETLELAELKALVQQKASQRNNSTVNVTNNQQRKRAQIKCWGCGDKAHVQQKYSHLD